MQNNFEDELRGPEDEAVAAQQQIGKYFKRYGDSGHQDACKHQLIFASRIMHTIAKCEVKHPIVYNQIITEVFGDTLRPDSGAKYWSTYVNSIRYFHYNLVTKKQYETASQVYHYISAYNYKLQTEDVSITIVNIYCNHLYLQNSHLQSNRRKALGELNHVVENLTYLFEEMLVKNKELNLQYKDVLRRTLQWLFPSSGLAKINQFFNNLSDGKVAAMFIALFKLYTQQRVPLPPKEEIHQQAQFIVETMDTLIVFDVIDKFQLQLGVQLMRHCRLYSHLHGEKPIAELFLQLYGYLRLTCAQEPTAGFDNLITKHCEGFKTLFEMYSKGIVNQTWFKDLLVLLNTIHTQMQNTSAFACFWRQMTSMSSYQALLMLLLETMKLAPCITSETKLNSISCCSSFRKHIILSFANTALSTFVLYCQNVKNEPEVETAGAQDTQDPEDMKQPTTDTYSEMLHKPLILIVSHAFKVIEKMDCIVSTSQDIKLLLTRFKQAALSACTERQAKTCIKLCELFLKINNKIADVEWPLVLRRVYKAAAQCLGKNPLLVRDSQMCYIASLLQLPNEIDFNQIRGQISLYYSDSYKEEQQHQDSQKQKRQKPEDQTPPPPQHDTCLMHMLQHSTNPLKPHLKGTRKKLLHWLEMQHAVKYYRSNMNLMQSLILSSQSYYDFVITTRATKLTTPDVPKFMSIYKHLRTKTGLGRLEQLTYGHACTKLLQEYQNYRAQTTPLDSKDFAEDQLEQLLQHKEMEKMTICNELQYVKLAYDAFKSFATFYDNFDQEQITSDDALIDWEAVIDDLTAVAQFLQFGSYMEYSSQAWMLHYKISQLLLDSFSALRGLAFFCEFSEFYEENGTTSTAVVLKLDKEIQLHLPAITNALDNLGTVQRRKQNFVLLATLQIAYYYVRCAKYTYAQMLLQFVEEKHCELPERQGRYDIIMATLDVIRYRLLWKHAEAKYAGRNKHSSAAEQLLLNQCLMGEIEQTLDRLREFVFVTGDGLAYNMLITSLAQDMAECSANRLYDNFLNSLFVVACKCALQYGFALRMAQVMCTWMWINLQMEYVDAAQAKLKLIEYIMGIKSLKELSGSSVKAIADIKSSTLLPETSNDLLGFNHNTGMEAMRRLAQVQLSPIKTGKLQLRPETRKTDLKSYFHYKIDTKTLPQNELLEWTYFTIGCLNARLYFLVEDYVQLEVFYEKGSQWLETRQNDFNKRYFRNVQLMAMQHYANFLRASRQQEKAIQCLNQGLELCDALKLDIDVVYQVNFKLQLLAARRELDVRRENKTKLAYGKIKRALKFNLSPEEDKYKCEKARRVIRDQLLQQAAMSSSKRPAVAVVVTSSNSSSSSSCSGTLSTRKPKSQAASSSGSSSPEATKCKLKAKHKFNICEDAIEIIDSDDNNDSVESKTGAKNGFKSTKETKAKKSNEHYTPKILRKTDKSSAKATTKISPPLNDDDKHHSMDSLDIPTSIATPITNIASTSSSSSTENLQTKENLPHNDLIKKLENLELVDKPKKLNTRVGRPRKSPLLKKHSAPVIILEDSPSLKTVVNAVPKSRTTRLMSNKLPDVVISGSGNESESTVRTTRRRRNIIMENNEHHELNGHPSNQPSSTSTETSAMRTTSTRRRQKI